MQWCKALRALIGEQRQSALSGKVRLHASGSQAALSAAQLLVTVLGAESRHW